MAAGMRFASKLAGAQPRRYIFCNVLRPRVRGGNGCSTDAGKEKRSATVPAAIIGVSPMMPDVPGEDAGYHTRDVRQSGTPR